MKEEKRNKRFKFAFAHFASRPLDIECLPAQDARSYLKTWQTIEFAFLNFMNFSNSQSSESTRTSECHYGGFDPTACLRHKNSSDFCDSNMGLGRRKLTWISFTWLTRTRNAINAYYFKYHDFMLIKILHWIWINKPIDAVWHRSSIAIGRNRYDDEHKSMVAVCIFRMAGVCRPETRPLFAVHGVVQTTITLCDWMQRNRFEAHYIAKQCRPKWIHLMDLTWTEATLCKYLADLTLLLVIIVDAIPMAIIIIYLLSVE